MAAAKKSSVKAAYWFAAENGSFPASQINVSLFTHLFCGFALAKPPTYKVDFPLPEDPFKTFNDNVKQRKNDIKTILSIGGTNSQMPEDDASREAFIKSSIYLARKYGFDGLDLCWLYPRSQSEMQNLGKLLVDLRSAIAGEVKAGHRQPLLLTMAVYFSPSIDKSKYPVEEMKRNLDWANVTAYNLTDPTKLPTATAAPAPVFSFGSGPSSVSAGLEQWLGCLPPTQLVLGLPFFGYAWNLVDETNHDIGAPAEGPYNPGTPPDGFRTYREIKQLVDISEFTHVYQPKLVADYCYRKKMWVGYDGPQTPYADGAINTKVLYAKNEKGLLGYFAWTVGWDGQNELAETAFNTWG